MTFIYLVVETDGYDDMQTIAAYHTKERADAVAAELEQADANLDVLGEGVFEYRVDEVELKD